MISDDVAVPTTTRRRMLLGLMMAGAAGLGLGVAPRERSAQAAPLLGPAQHGPSAHGLSAHGPSVHGPSVHGPALVPVAEEPAAACSRADQSPMPPPGTPGSSGFWSRYREPMPPVSVYNAPGRKRVGLQAGHWLTEQVPAELRGLGPGAYGGGKSEWEVNLDVARRAADLLRDADVEVDVLPTTLPVEYRAHVFLSLHADGDASGALRGWKLGRAVWSATPEADDRLMASIAEEYRQAVPLPVDPVGASRRMTAYYAFNSRRYCHAILPGTASAIFEMGFLTNATDRETLLGNPQVIARAVADGVQRYLATLDSAPA